MCSRPSGRFCGGIVVCLPLYNKCGRPWAGPTYSVWEAVTRRVSRHISVVLSVFPV